MVGIGEEDAAAGGGAAADPAPHLVQLREPEALGVLDQHPGRIWHVDADFDHHRGDEQVELPLAELLHHLVLGGLRQPAVKQAKAELAQGTRLEVLKMLLGGLQVEAFGFLHERADDISLLALFQLLAQILIDAFALVLCNDGCADRLPARRQLPHR